MGDSDVTVSFGGLSTVLFVVFLILKLTGNIVWSWWWVCSPLIIGYSLSFILIIIVFIVAASSDW